MGLPAPDFDTFWQQGSLKLPSLPDDGGILRAFRDDPMGASLPTPSGRIEITSAKVSGFGYDDCPGHPTWLKQSDVPDGQHPLWLVANQPATRLHSQFDYGGHSDGSKVRGREVLRLHPDDAAARGISDGDIVRVFNARGACLAAASVRDDIRPGVAQLPTGAWYDPETPAEDNPTCVHGNPNVLTRDVGTSRLAQGCTGQLTSVEVERYEGQVPPIRAFDPPGG
jgi:biotin/methionine sulfoxide reductase